jgi:hypothetical protein
VCCGYVVGVTSTVVVYGYSVCPLDLSFAQRTYTGEILGFHSDVLLKVQLFWYVMVCLWVGVS